jgi:hypothetical protein
MSLCDIQGPQAEKDGRGPIFMEEWSRAVKYIQSRYSKNDFEKIWENVKENNTDWRMKAYLGFGTGVRNALRDGGFSWGQISLESNWAVLMEDAARDLMCNDQNFPK